MKKIIFIAFIAFFSALNVQAQEFKFGVKGGVNVASIGGDGTGVSGVASKVGGHIGGVVQIPIATNFSIQPELLYSMEGSKGWWYVHSYGNYGDTKLDYVRIPVMGQYHILEGLTAQLGPVFGVLVSAKSGSVDIKDGYNGFDAQLGIGATYTFDFGLFGGLRYNKGLMNISKDYTDPDTHYIYSYTQNSNVFQISVGYYF